ncbi:MAG: rRNA maturation RNase YbeY [Candidatus Limnocylindrales bacterium]
MTDRTRSRYRPPWRVDVTVRDGVLSPLPVSGLVRAVAAALTAAGAPQPASIGLILADDAELAALNRTHMGKSGATDVLSFPLLPAAAFPANEGRHDGRAGDGVRAVRSGDPSPAAFVPPGRRIHLGDIVVSVERAVAQADQGRGGHTGDVRWAPADELRLLVIHGTLHVCGWDHAEPAEEAAMRALERRLLG